MRNRLILILAFVVFAFFGCGGDDDNGNSNPVGPGGIGIGGGGTGGGGNTANVTFTVTSSQEQDGVYFIFNPSVNVTVNTVTASLPAQQYQDATQGDGTTVFGPQNNFYVGPYTGVASGQAWTFTIVGKKEGANGTAYTSTANYTVP